MNAVKGIMSNTTKCPICGAPSDLKYQPFCSKHCADVDLGRWLKGVYVVHTNEMPESSKDVQEKDDE